MKSSFAQNIGIGTITPAAKLQINHRNTASSPSLTFFDSSGGTGSRILFTRENMVNNFSVVSTLDVIAANSSLDFRTTLFSAIFMRGDRRVGINNTSPSATLHVGGGIKVQDTLNVSSDLNVEGKLKLNGNAGTLGQVLVSNGNSTDPVWDDLSGRASGNVGFGSWGDCANTANISEYEPISEPVPESGAAMGMSVAIAGNYAAAGIPYDDVGANTDQGSVNIYQYNGLNWVFLQKISEAGGAGFDLFGKTLAMDGNYLAIGIPADDIGANSGAGSVVVYQLSGGTWTFMQKITDATGLANDNFGDCVALSGNFLVVGSPFDDTGAGADAGSVSIYQLSGGTWTLMQKITDATGAAGDHFGNAVSVSANVAMIGAPDDDNASQADAGSASIFQFNGTNWVLATKLVGSIASDNLGHTVAINGNYAFAGIPFYGSSPITGAVNVYYFNGTGWVLQQTLFDTDNTSETFLGFSLSSAGNYMMAGTHSMHTVILFQKINGGLWKKMQQIRDPGGESGSFGASVSIDGTSKRFVIGSPQGAIISGTFFPFGPGLVNFGKIN